VIPPSVEEAPAKPSAPARHGGFLSKIRRFFGAIFR